MAELHRTLVVIGQGYVGLPLAREAVRAGFVVIGLDADPTIVDRLTAGRSHVDDISDSDLAAMRAAGYRATSDADVLATADVVVICVPTPLREGEPDLSAVEAATVAAASRIRPGALVVLESTSYPGTTEDVVRPLFAAEGREVDRDFFLAYSPERIDPGNATWTLRNTPKVVGGVTKASTAQAEAFYREIVDTVVPVRGAREAEMAKLLENTYRHVNIALVNEMARFCHELGIDLWEAIRAASTKPFGYQAFYPGPGVGGHCIPIDPNYLGFEVQRRLGYPFRFVELAGEVNRSMPRYVVERVQDLLNDASRSVRGARVLLLGVTYKADISDQRESPADEIAVAFRAKGAELEYHDPYVPVWDAGGERLSVVTDLDAAVQAADVVVLLQAHRAYDLDRLTSLAGRFFDTRGVADPSRVSRL